MIDRTKLPTRVSRYVVLLASAAATAVGASVAHAQAAAGATAPWSIGVAGSATFGNRTGGAFGVEVGRRMAHEVGLFAEAGRLLNLGTSDLDARAQRIGTVIGASSDPTYRVTYVDAGLRYELPAVRRLRPYALAGAGAARVTTVASFSTNGREASLGDAGVRLGADLEGTITNPYLTGGAGAIWNIGNRYALDASYRYGRMLARTSEIDGDTGIDVNRVRLGGVIRF